MHFRRRGSRPASFRARGPRCHRGRRESTRSTSRNIAGAPASRCDRRVRFNGQAARNTGGRAIAASTSDLAQPQPKVAPLPHERTTFAHNSERQFAKLLDFYEIDWAYEPTTFDIAWDREGDATQRFSPDFYLPQYDLYIEITTLNQKLVTKKNRKARRLGELYPDVKCRVLYQRDYLNLLVKYGLEEPSQKNLLPAVDETSSLSEMLTG